MAAPPKLELLYFDIHGLGARIRLAAAVGGVPLEDYRFASRDEFAALKKKHPNLTAFWLDGLDETASAILNLDLVVTVDTMIAHLASTLGVPTWIMVPRFSTDWRWQLDRTDSPWYPAARLWRQQKVGEWKSVIERIGKELAVHGLCAAA